MAKVPFTKLKCKINEDTIPIQIGEETIAVKQYLPIQEKLALISRVADYAHTQDANYSNPVKATVLRDLEIVYSYTNITFTDKQKEDIPKLYDMLYSCGALDKIIAAIPEKEYNIICKGIRDSIEAIYQYLNSIVGVIDTITKAQENATVDINTVQEGLEKLQNSPIIKDVLPLIGLE